MEKIKIYLNEQECKEYDEATCFSSIISVCLKHLEKTLDFVDLKKFKILEYRVIHEASHLYSFILKLERIEKNAKK